MKVAIVINSLAPGGAEQSTVAIMPYLQELGVEFTVLALRSKPGLLERVHSFGIDVHFLDPSRGRRGWISQIRSHLRDDEPQLVHTCLFEADICGRLAAASRRVPVVSTLPSELYGRVHYDDPSLSAGRVRASHLADGLTAHLTRRLHAVSAHVADSMAKRLRYPRDRIDVVYRGRSASIVDEPEGFPGRDLIKASLGLDQGAKVLLVVARHERAKGIDRLLPALPAILAKHPESRLLVAGREGEHTPELRALVDRLQIGRAVNFLGHRTDVASLYRASDAFVVLSRREGLPGAVLEAMAAGTPIVANRLPQICEVVDEHEALMVNGEEVASVVAGIDAVFTDPAAARSRVDAGKERFLETFTLDRVAEQMFAFYTRSIASTASD